VKIPQEMPAAERAQLWGSATAPTKQNDRRKGGRASDPVCKQGHAETGLYGTLGDMATKPRQWLMETARWLENSDDTDPVQALAWCCDDFRPRKLKAPLVLAWLVVQGFGIIFQTVLYYEVVQHLVEFEDTIAKYCGPEHQQKGVCLGPIWNLSYSGILSFPPTQGSDSRSDFDFIIPSGQSFDFNIKSTPPTFLVGVEPQKPHAKARWRLSLSARGESGELEMMSATGDKYNVFTSKYRPVQAWSASMTLKSSFSEYAQIHVYVVDSNLAHLEDVHAQGQCGFEESWGNFNERHSGQHHQVMWFTKHAVTFFLLVSMCSAGLVLHRFYFYVESGKLLGRIIMLKFVVQDFPQQMCLVMYLFSWYARDGLRCQMCLFHPKHCDEQQALHWTNLMVCFFTLLSAVANQLLLQAKARRYEDDEECFLWCARGAMLSVSVLPFSTAILFSPSMLHLGALVYFAAGVPTLVGWFTLICIPLATACDDDDIF